MTASAVGRIVPPYGFRWQQLFRVMLTAGRRSRISLNLNPGYGWAKDLREAA
jgi:hypothetical protein